MNLFLKIFLFWNEILNISDNSSVHHQEFFTVHTVVLYVTQVCWQPASRILILILILLARCLQTCMTYTTAVCTVKNSWCWTEELSETFRISFQNKNFWEISASIWFYYKTFITMHGHTNAKIVKQLLQTGCSCNNDRFMH